MFLYYNTMTICHFIFLNILLMHNLFNTFQHFSPWQLTNELALFPPHIRFLLKVLFFLLLMHLTYIFLALIRHRIAFRHTIFTHGIFEKTFRALFSDTPFVHCQMEYPELFIAARTINRNVYER